MYLCDLEGSSWRLTQSLLEQHDGGSTWGKKGNHSPRLHLFLFFVFCFFFNFKIFNSYMRAPPPFGGERNCPKAFLDTGHHGIPEVVQPQGSTQPR